MCWATVAALGVSAALLAWSKLLVAIKLFGGLYLLWLAFKSGRTAWSGKAAASTNAAGEQRLSRFYVRGAMLHLTNPKAILVWVSIVALSSNGAGASHGAVVPGCIVIGCRCSAAMRSCSRWTARAGCTCAAGARWKRVLPSCSAWRGSGCWCRTSDAAGPRV